MVNIKEIKIKAKEKLKNKWMKGVMVFFTFLLLSLFFNILENQVIYMLKIPFPKMYLKIALKVMYIIIRILLLYGIVSIFIKLKRNEELKILKVFKDAFFNFSRIWKITIAIIKKLSIPLIIFLVIYIGFPILDHYIFKLQDIYLNGNVSSIISIISRKLIFDRNL